VTLKEAAPVSWKPLAPAFTTLPPNAEVMVFVEEAGHMRVSYWWKESGSGRKLGVIAGWIPSTPLSVPVPSASEFPRREARSLGGLGTNISTSDAGTRSQAE
jgi:hypothetical protein